VFSVAEIILKQFQNFSVAKKFISVSDVVTCETKHYNNFKIQNNFISHVTTVLIDLNQSVLLCSLQLVPHFVTR